MSSSPPPVPIDELLRHAAWVRGLARSLVHDDAAADDALQETWTAALRSPPRDADTSRAWLARVVRNAVRARGRADARRVRREEAVARSEGLEATADVVARAEQHRRLVLALMELDEPYRRTLLLRFFEELPPRDVAARMQVPVETVRTRTRRGLALLRERLDDEEHGDRSRWVRALVPLADSSAPRAHEGGPRMSVRVAVVASLLLATVPVVWFAAAQEAPPPALPGGVASGTPLASSPRDPRAHVGSTVHEADEPLAPGDDGEGVEEEDGETSDAVDGGVVPLPPADDAATYADGVLAYTLAVDPPTPRAGQPFEIVATFENRGTGPLRFHVPEFAGLVPFPGFELRSAEGARYDVAEASFQSEWVRGLQGTVVRLEPRATHAVRTTVSVVAPIDADAPFDPSRRSPSQRALELPPGDYVLSARLRHERPTVPWGESGFRVSEKEVAGLWTGVLDATPISFRIAPPDEPLLVLRGPEAVVPGAVVSGAVVSGAGTAFVLEITNPTTSEHVLRGAFALRRSTKGGPGHVAWFAFGDAARSAPRDPAAELRLPAGETRTCRIDATALRWELVRRTVPLPLPREAGLAWPHVREHPAVWVTCGERGDDAEGEIRSSNTLFVPFEAAPDLAARGLVCELDASALLADPPTLLVRLRNAGGETLRLRGGAARLRVWAERTGELLRALDISSVETGADAGADAPAALATGETRTLRVVLAPDGVAALPAGAARIRASWADADGRDDATVGAVVAAPVAVEVPAR